MKELAVTYARVSSKPQEDGFSLISQNRTITQYAASRKFEIVRDFTSSESAKKQGRKNFNAMLAFLREHPDVRIVIVEKTDRLVRNLHDFVEIEDLVEELDIEIHLVKEGQVLRRSAKSQDRLVQGMFALLARNYIQNMLEEISKGQIEKAKNGDFPGRARYGYKHDRENRTIIAHPDRQPVVRLVFELFATGNYSIKALRQAIIRQTGERISKSYLHKILTSRFYIGTFRWKTIEYAGNHPALIDPGTFQRVQAIVTGKSKSKPRRHSFPFADLLYCANCGCAVTAELHKQIHTYYHCTFGRGRHAFPYIKEDTLAELLSPVFTSLNVTPELARVIEAQTSDANSARAASLRQKIGTLKQRLTAAETRMANAFREKSNHPDLVDDDVYANCMEQFREEKNQIKADLESACQSPIGDIGLSASRVVDLARRAHEIYQRSTNQHRAQLLKMVLSSCKTDGTDIHPEFREPFGLIFGSAGKEKKPAN